jgi:hypothetical protein
VETFPLVNQMRDPALEPIAAAKTPCPRVAVACPEATTIVHPAKVVLMRMVTALAAVRLALRARPALEVFA